MIRRFAGAVLSLQLMKGCLQRMRQAHCGAWTSP